MIPINPKLLAFDIETSEQAQDDKISPITVASTVTSDGEEHAWFSHPTDKTNGMIGKGTDETWANYSSDGKLSPLMSRDTAQAMLEYMSQKVEQGYSLCAWNGAGFDLKMIGHLADNVELAGQLTMNLIDPMYQVLTIKGYPVGLAAVQKGLGIAQEKSMAGKDAPDAWGNGEYQKVIGYVIGDSQITLQIVLAIAKANGMKWTSKTGKPCVLSLSKLKTIAECLLDPEPNNSWMDNPIDRNKILAWIPEDVKNQALQIARGEKPKAKKDSFAGKPVWIIISGPSGVGKSTLCKALMSSIPAVKRSITTTTRKQRPGEKEGEEYNFVSDEQFQQMAASGDFLEQAKVYGYQYGSTKKDVSSRLAKGEDVVMIVDVQGAKSIREFYVCLPHQTRNKFHFADVFITPPSIEHLKQRLSERKRDDQTTMEQRLSKASEEMSHASSFKYTVINDDLLQATERLKAILIAEKSLSDVD